MFREFAAGLLVCGWLAGGGEASAGSTRPADPAQLPSGLPDPATAPALKDLFAARFFIGGAIQPSQLAVPADLDLLRKHFSSITAETVMKPATIGPAEGRYNFAPADQLIRFAEANSMHVRGHTLLWHRNAPTWFFAGDRSDGAAYRALVRRRLETYIANVVAHFRGKLYSWDVVNEVASDNAGETYRETSPWFTALGPDYIDYAFRAARAADPGARLYLNDYNTEQPQKRARVLAIVRDLKAKGVPIDGVGHQLHLHVNASATAVDEALRAVEALGLENQVTELDVSIYADPGSCYANHIACQPDSGGAVSQSTLSRQAALYRSLFDVFKAHPSITAVTTWGLSDGHTWLNRFPVTRTNLPLLFDTSRQPKWAFWAVADPSIRIP
ncbi:MAG TPA: endo-1,4-beta-xylanase [Steroidobacteraceae bacterium]|nr:endo-1,4-beta-xylanase [Steroidobacteraceae bacterium]